MTTPEGQHGATNGNGWSLSAFTAERSGAVAADAPALVFTHLARAIARYARQSRKDGLPVPSIMDELAAFLTLYVRTRHIAAGVDGDHRSPQCDSVVQRRLLITKAEAAEQLGISVRTVERLIAGGRLRLVHVEGAARLRVADLEAYVDSLVNSEAVKSAQD
ncbi:MAG TPA: helix-turn-helix domain-containing protein [Propionibacteriaceae bacterium]|nr:helix-turn-helix domain-containing protein [Propionibacteriaceae bacterium]